VHRLILLAGVASFSRFLPFPRSTVEMQHFSGFVTIRYIHGKVLQECFAILRRSSKDL